MLLGCRAGPSSPGPVGSALPWQRVVFSRQRLGRGVALAQADCVGGCDYYGPCACNGAQTCCTGCDCGGSPVPCCCNAPSNDCAYSHYTQNNGYCGCFIGC